MPSRKKSIILSRKQGAQLGNHNAFKHGFYAKKYFPLELSDLGTALGDGLGDEISLLRVVIRRVFNYANDHDQQTFDTWSDCLNTLGVAGVRLASMVRTHALLTGNKHAHKAILLAHIDHEFDVQGWPDPRRPANVAA